ncbi:hypothetical protein, conserved [Eimeria brunetti]|uniref:Uncharacterized protein n=1 Tax=Eimeria brunetti TaxID=51314 RepID=U6LJK5_9EIME|nr:hypothetical protein, conserved [Eimeria brunetti]
MASVAALLQMTRLRHALLNNARRTLEVLSKAIRADEASVASQVVASFLDVPQTSLSEGAHASTAATTAQSFSEVPQHGSTCPESTGVSRQNKVTPPATVCDGSPLEHAACPSGTFVGPCTTKAASKDFDSRLDESEAWFLTDIFSGCDEGNPRSHRSREGTNGSAGSILRSASSGSGDRGSTVMVSSVDSSLSVDSDVDDISSKSSAVSSKDEGNSRSITRVPGSVSSVYPTTREDSRGDYIEATTDLERQMEQDTVPLLSEVKRQSGGAIYVINRKRICDGERLYMIEAGHGWRSYHSLEHLLCFLGETVKVFGADRLRSTKFLLPVNEAEGFLDELQKIAPYCWEDFVVAAKEASYRVFLALAARFLFAQLTEAVAVGGTATEIAAVTAAGPAAAAGVAATAAGETAATATGAASLCSTAVAVIPWVILIGGCVYGVFCGVRKLRNVRSKVVLCPTTKAEATELEEGIPHDAFRDHCIIKWG